MEAREQLAQHLGREAWQFLYVLAHAPDERLACVRVLDLWQQQREPRDHARLAWQARRLQHAPNRVDGSGDRSLVSTSEEGDEGGEARLRYGRHSSRTLGDGAGGAARERRRNGAEVRGELARDRPDRLWSHKAREDLDAQLGEVWRIGGGGEEVGDGGGEEVRRLGRQLGDGTECGVGDLRSVAARHAAERPHDAAKILMR